MSATDQELSRERDADAGADADTDDTPTSVSELPPSAKLVYKVLEYEGAMTQEEIAAESRLCARTVRYALSKLEDAEFVSSRACLKDARQSKYWIDE